MAGGNGQRRATLASVARLAGVSVPTVSKVLNDRDDVAEETRERVRRALTESGYAAQRRTQPPGPPVVDLVVEGLTNRYTVEVLGGIIDGAADLGVEVVLSSVSPARFREADHGQWAERLAAAGRRGLVLVSSEVQEAQVRQFSRRNLPVVVVDPLSPPVPSIVSVGSTNWAGGKAATEHLIGLGHRRIAHVGGPVGAECSQARLHGYLAAHMSAGLPADQDLVLAGDFVHATGVAGLERLLQLPSPPTAVFCGNDVIALGVLDEARRRGLRVPADLSVVGFDGTDLTEHAHPRLTSVAQPLREMGLTALRAVVRLAEGEDLESHYVELATQLVVRDSTAPPQAPAAPPAAAAPAARRARPAPATGRR
ncbi:LacI family transcriptional regulator [Kineococcus xinjiangensis]|uniref:LacI family transcriptional regulator n=1 Tax=Kineococcus xinjiangensis TaxID=512762 RepID=A0A2S6IKD4_9ACTN|nr:substrate-binding domain-containing protein [Kineococcus xinjiangensis]PPK94693.1 LacI family transcriptional regulator [Kineococcus xinjiangensis]